MRDGRTHRCSNCDVKHCRVPGGAVGKEMKERPQAGNAEGQDHEDCVIGRFAPPKPVEPKEEGNDGGIDKRYKLEHISELSQCPNRSEAKGTLMGLLKAHLQPG